MRGLQEALLQCNEVRQPRLDCGGGLKMSHLSTSIRVMMEVQYSPALSRRYVNKEQDDGKGEQDWLLLQKVNI